VLVSQVIFSRYLDKLLYIMGIVGSLFSCWENMVRLVVGRTLSFVSH